MPDVAGSTGLAWGPSTGVISPGLDILWGFATLVTSIGGTFTPHTPPPGSTPTAPNTDADFVIGASPIYRVVHNVTITDLRDDTPVEFESMNLSCDAGAVCWTLSASGDASLFARFTNGELPVVEIVIDGNVWHFIIEGIRRSRGFQASGVEVTGRSLTIYAGEPYQFPENWVNAGPATAQQIMAQAQIYSGLEIDWQVEDWLVPDRAWSFSGTPLAVVQRVAESIGAVLRSDRVENRISVLPRYRLLPNEWREAVPDVEIHLDAHMADSWERADRPAYNGVFVSGRVDGGTAFVYLSGTSGERLAPMVTDDLLTETPALRQRGEAVLGAGGPQANVRITLPVLDGPTFPGVFEINWLCRIVEPGKTWYGVVRAVSVDVGFPSVTQTITLEHHTADITGTVVNIPAPPPPPTGLALAWFNPINDPVTGALAHANSGTGVCDDFALGTPVTQLCAGVVGLTDETVVWSIASWDSVEDASPFLTYDGLPAGTVRVQWVPLSGWVPEFPFVSSASIGTLTLTATINGTPVAVGQRLVAVTTPPTVDYPNIAWGPE